MSEKRYPRRCTAAPGTKWSITKYAEVREPGARMHFVHWDGSEARACEVFENEGLFDQWIKGNYAVETFDHLPPIEQPTDKDAHGMYKAEPSELAALQVQIRRVVDQCEAVIGEKAHAIPFGMAVSEAIATLTKRAELAEAGAAKPEVDTRSFTEQAAQSLKEIADVAKWWKQEQGRYAQTGKR